MATKNYGYIKNARLNPEFKNWVEAGYSLNEPPGRYTRPEYRQAFNTLVRQLAITANGRLTRLENEDLKRSPSYQQLNGKRFDTDPAKLTGQDIVKEFTRLRLFLDNKTSTPAGFRRVHAAVEKRLSTKLTYDEADFMWESYNKFKAMHPNWENVHLTSEDAQKLVREYINEDDESDVVVKLVEDRLKEMLLLRRS